LLCNQKNNRPLPDGPVITNRNRMTEENFKLLLKEISRLSKTQKLALNEELQRINKYNNNIHPILNQDEIEMLSRVFSTKNTP
jgi:hypothetical protein